MIRRMSSPAPPTTRSWLRAPRLVTTAFAIQALASLVAWFVVNDRSRGSGVWSNTDFREWAALSSDVATTLVVLSMLVVRRWHAMLAVSTGCALAGLLGLAIFIGWAVFNSA